jgi:hypothetical protein
VRRTPRELIAPVVDPEVPYVTDIYELIVAAPAVAVDDSVWRDPAAYYGQKRAPAAARHDFRIDMAVAVEDAEDDSLAARPAPAFASDAARAEVAFVHLDLTAGGDCRSHSSSTRTLILRKTEVTLLRVGPVSFDTSEAVQSNAKQRTTWRNLRSEILDRL